MHDFGHGVLKEEAQHFSAGIRPARVGVGAGWTASRPRVPGSVQNPLLLGPVSRCLIVRQESAQRKEAKDEQE